MQDIYHVEVVGHTRREDFNKLLQTAVDNLQHQMLAVEVQFAKDRGSYNALVIARRT